MRKTFPLEVEGLQPPRVVEGVKHEVRKYVKRERKKKLPEGVDFWDFACRVGGDEASAVAVHLEEVTKGIDAAVGEGRKEVFVEIVAKPGTRTKREKGAKKSAE
jgi:hypothetical protein